MTTTTNEQSKTHTDATQGLTLRELISNMQGVSIHIEGNGDSSIRLKGCE